MIDIPIWPAKLARDQQRIEKQRRKTFEAALKSHARAAGWRYAGGDVFRQAGDWFVDVFPTLLWQRGALARMMIKPMALDPLFWDIVGLQENASLPLSFRAHGAWVLRPSAREEYVGLETRDAEPLASEILQWSTDRSNDVLAKISISRMLADLPGEAELRGGMRALAICLHILDDDLAQAMRLCRQDPASDPMWRDSGGFNTHQQDGTVSSFIDQARDWITRNQRSEIASS